MVDIICTCALPRALLLVPDGLSTFREWFRRAFRTLQQEGLVGGTLVSKAGTGLSPSLAPTAMLQR
jgi:hypothetical protein